MHDGAAVEDKAAGVATCRLLVHDGAAVQAKAASIAMQVGCSIIERSQTEIEQPAFQPTGVKTHLNLLLLALRDCCCQYTLPRLDNVQTVPGVGCPGNHIALPIFPQLKGAH